MKKLLFALAGAATFVAMAADPAKGEGDIEVAGFENLTAETSVLDFDDEGGSGASSWTTNKVGDTSLVKTYGGDNVAAPASGQSVPKLFEATLGGSNYLALETNGAELQRKINGSSGQTVGSDGLYIDTLVQFTPSESAPSDISGAKLAIWLGVENDVTNLCVAGGYYYDNEGAPSVGSNKVYSLSGTYDAGTWYRLTVKAVDISNTSQVPLVGFSIYVNGVAVAATEAVYDSSIGAMLKNVMTSENQTLIDGGKFIPVANAVNFEALTLSTVGFQGSGAVDDLVVTTNDPFYVAPTTIAFTLTFGEGISAVAYTVGEESGTFTSGTPVNLPYNGSVTITPTYAENYGFGSFTTNGVASDLTFTLPASGDTFTAVLSATYTPPTGWVDDPATIVEGTTAGQQYTALAGTALANADAKKLTVWAKANSVTFTDATTTADNYVEAFLLNCAPDAATVAAEKAAFVLTITFDGGNAVVNLPDGKTYNGTLQLKGSTDLTTWTDTEVTTGYKFFKYELSL